MRVETIAIPSMSDTVTHQHLIRAMDALIDSADTVEEALARQIRLLVDQVRSIVFYVGLVLDFSAFSLTLQPFIEGKARADG